MSDIKTFDGWEIEKKLGKGSYGSVYQIKKKGENIRSALKVIEIPTKTILLQYKANGNSDEYIKNDIENCKNNFLSECKLLSDFRGHSNVVSYEDHIVITKNLGYEIHLRMELLKELTEVLNETPPTPELAVKVGVDICKALELCAPMNIVHRDIKPQNIFVNANNDYKLGDFGIAKILSSKDNNTNIGTPNYISPEVYCKGECSAQSDIYSLGIVLYWLLNDRRLPFFKDIPGKTSSELEREANQQRLSNNPVPPPKHGSVQLKSAVLKSLEYETSARYSTPAELKKALIACPEFQSLIDFSDYKIETDGATTATLEIPNNHNINSKENRVGKDIPNNRKSNSKIICPYCKGAKSEYVFYTIENGVAYAEIQTCSCCFGEGIIDANKTIKYIHTEQKSNTINENCVYCGGKGTVSFNGKPAPCCVCEGSRAEIIPRDVITKKKTQNSICTMLVFAIIAALISYGIKGFILNECTTITCAILHSLICSVLPICALVIAYIKYSHSSFVEKTKLKLSTIIFSLAFTFIMFFPLWLYLLK